MELLVVITIILILAGLVIYAIGTVREGSQKTDAANTISRLYVAIEQYKMEKPYPGADDAADYPEDEKTSSNADYWLTYDDSPADPPKRILNKIDKYFTYDRKYLRSSDGALLDPWKQPFFYDNTSDGTEITNWNNLETNSGIKIDHEVQIFSCGPPDKGGRRNIENDESEPKDWKKIIYKKGP